MKEETKDISKMISFFLTFQDDKFSKNAHDRHPPGRSDHGSDHRKKGQQAVIKTNSKKTPRRKRGVFKFSKRSSDGQDVLRLFRKQFCAVLQQAFSAPEAPEHCYAGDAGVFRRLEIHFGITYVYRLFRAAA